MAEICPFLGIRYNQELVKDGASVICPPHDVIPPALQDELYHRSDYNFIRIEFGRELPQDTMDDNRYTRASATLEQWLKQGVLQPEAQPAIYIHDYFFTYQGKHLKRRGMIARVRLEEWSKRIIFPHEGTLSRSKSDRLSLLWACQANTSPILAMFQDVSGEVTTLMAMASKQEPAIFITCNDEAHTVWAITDTALVNGMVAAMATRPLYIADGHHRYESALLYNHEREACETPTGTKAYHFVMMTLVEFNDPGLLILPPHRLVRGVNRATLHNLREKLAAFFELEAIPLRAPDLWPKVDRLLTGSLDRVQMCLYGLDADNIYLLQLKDRPAVGEMMPAFHTEIYRRLDVSVVDHIILEKLLGAGSEEGQTTLSYTYEKQDAVNRVLDQEYQLAILLNPVQAQTIKAIADSGDRMPRKSTYFYPKEPAGLVFNRLV